MHLKNRTQLKPFITFLFCSLYIVTTWTQQPQQTIFTEEGRRTVFADISEACNSEVFIVLPAPPAYQGGPTQLEDDLNAILTLPDDLNTKVRYWLTVNCNGKAFGFQPLLELEAMYHSDLIAALEQLQNWQPGFFKGNAVDCTIAISLKIRRGSIRRISY
jgi:hypothetical protein